ncbi:hypothetical protein N657DRAFT_636400 [Parathielavia appendiculata]|uniref:Uncharacterized protein n=1 Tax=Parathielavia appendiculata TaxID=2587402 RepID=A0AAN6TTY2_9PEZI|nr:hypothetical protein N657DRAFT_636400 [Parathielavia appendiculata]
MGMDAQMKYKQEFKSDLFNVGLPGLSYGVVTIGPCIAVGTRVTLEAEAKDKILGGAEMGLQNVHVKIDFINPMHGANDCWDPYFKPMFKVEGELMLAAALGLPIGLKCGLQISTWDKSADSFAGHKRREADPRLHSPARSLGTSGASPASDTPTPSESSDSVSSGSSGSGSSACWGSGSSGSGSSGADSSESSDSSASQSSDSGPSASGSSDSSGGFSESDSSSDSASAPSSPPTGSRSNQSVVDITSKIKASNNPRSSTMPPNPCPTVRTMTPTVTSTRLVGPDATMMVVSCSNGNLYPFPINGSDNAACSEMWASHSDILVADGSQRLAHYYNNTMSAPGVSRLRVEDEADIPMGGVVVGFAPYSYDGSHEDDSYFYLAVDPHDDVFYPTASRYEEPSLGARYLLGQGSGRRRGGAEERGRAVSVTGGKVTGCSPLMLMQGKYDDLDNYLSYTEARDSTPWDLENG